MSLPSLNTILCRLWESSEIVLAVRLETAGKDYRCERCGYGANPGVELGDPTDEDKAAGYAEHITFYCRFCGSEKVRPDEPSGAAG